MSRSNWLGAKALVLPPASSHGKKGSVMFTAFESCGLEPCCAMLENSVPQAELCLVMRSCVAARGKTLQICLRILAGHLLTSAASLWHCIAILGHAGSCLLICVSTHVCLLACPSVISYMPHSNSACRLFTCGSIQMTRLWLPWICWCHE